MDEDRKDPRQLMMYFEYPYQVVNNPNQLQHKTKDKLL